MQLLNHELQGKFLKHEMDISYTCILYFCKFWCCTLWSSKAPLGIPHNIRVGGISSYWAIILSPAVCIAEYNDITVFGNRTRLGSTVHD